MGEGYVLSKCKGMLLKKYYSRRGSTESEGGVGSLCKESRKGTETGAEHD